MTEAQNKRLERAVFWTRVASGLTIFCLGAGFSVGVWVNSMQKDLSRNSENIQVQIRAMEAAAGKVSEIQLWKASTEVSLVTIQKQLDRIERKLDKVP